MKTLKKDFEIACNAYLKAFCEKHGYDYEDARDAWVAGDVGGIVQVGDLFVGIDDIRTDIDRDAPVEEFLKHYDYTLRLHMISPDIAAPNYKSWLSGCPRRSEEEIAELEAARKRVIDAKAAMEEAIKKDDF